MTTTSIGTSNSSGPSLVISAAPPPPQPPSPVAIVIAAAAPPPPTLSVSENESNSSSMLLPLLQSCDGNMTIMSSSATTSSITTKNSSQILNNENGVQSNETSDNTDNLNDGLIINSITERENENMLSTSNSTSMYSNLNSLNTNNEALNDSGIIIENSAPVVSTPASIAASDEFVKKLIECVKKQPCLYNPNHEHYGNKHSSAQYRANVWQNLCKELDYPDDPHSLQTQWKRVRDRYVRERRKRKTSGIIDNWDVNSLNLSAAARHFNSMRWIDEFLNENVGSNSNAFSNAGSTNINNVSNGVTVGTSSGSGNLGPVGNLSTSGEIYYSQHPNRRRNTTTTKAGFDDSLINTHSYRYEQTSSNTMQQQTLSVSSGRAPSSGFRAPKNESSANGSPSSTSSEISVGSAAFGGVQVSQGGAQPHLMYRTKVTNGISNSIQQPLLSAQPQQHLIHHGGQSSSTSSASIVMSSTASGQHCELPYQLLSVPSAGSNSAVIGLPPQGTHSGSGKQEQIMTMVIDPSIGQFYQHNPATASGSSGIVGGNIINVNQQQPSQQQVHQQQQRMYRLVNLPSSSSTDLQQQHLLNHHHSQQQLITTTSTSELQQQKMLQQNSMPPRKKRMAILSQVQSRSQHLVSQQQVQPQQHEMLIDPNAHHSQQQSVPSQTIVIEQGQDRILINHQQQLQHQQLTHLNPGNPGADAMIVQHHASLHGIPQNSHQIHGNSTHLQHANLTGHTNSRLVTSRGGSRGILTEHIGNARQQILSQSNLGGQQHYIISAPAATQSHYDSDSALVETIVSHLANLNDDEKVVTKMNIQRILMDARFGRGACVRMFREEEQSENMAVAALEASNQQQNRHLHSQQQQNRR